MKINTVVILDQFYYAKSHLAASDMWFDIGLHHLE